MPFNTNSMGLTHTPNIANFPFPHFGSFLYKTCFPLCSFANTSFSIRRVRMEGQSKDSFDVMEGTESKGREFVEAKSTPRGTCDLLLRLLALVLTLVAVVVIGADKQTTVVPIKFADSLPPLNVPVTAKWHYLSAFVYFVVANVIACAYATLSIFLALANRSKSKGLGSLVTVLDALMVALLFSGNGAAIAVGILGSQGNSHVHWNKVCNVFGKFCNQEAASLMISLLGSIAFLLLVMLPALRLHRTA